MKSQRLPFNVTLGNTSRKFHEHPRGGILIAIPPLRAKRPRLPFENAREAAQAARSAGSRKSHVKR